MAFKQTGVERTKDDDLDVSPAARARPTTEIDSLQRSAGNRATALLLDMGQARLRVGASNDRFEREADDVAARVVSALAGTSDTGATHPGGAVTAGLQRRAVVDEAGGELDAPTESLIARARSGGSTLDPDLRRSMESTIGADFTGVRIHTGAAADALNDRIQASAFTIGNDIFFRGGAPDTDSASGQELMAHELTHTVQQGAATAQRTTVPAGRSGTSIQRRGRGKGKKKAAPAKKPAEVLTVEEPSFDPPEPIPTTTEAKPEVKPVDEPEVTPELTPTAKPEAVAQSEPKKKLTKGQRKKARAEREQAEAEAAAKAKQEAEAKAEAERIALAKTTFEANENTTISLVTKARAAVAPYPQISSATLESMVDEIVELKKAEAPDWLALVATLSKINTEANRIGQLSSFAAQGRLGKNGKVLDVRKQSAPGGDKIKGEMAAVKETIDAIGGTGTWNGTNANGEAGKWGAYHGNNENNLPPGGYKEYYVRAPTGVGSFGGRRIVIHNTTGNIYYTWTHYGDNGNPPFVLLVP